jgi:hypothetical protein
MFVVSIQGPHYGANIDDFISFECNLSIGGGIYLCERRAESGERRADIGERKFWVILGEAVPISMELDTF